MIIVKNRELLVDKSEYFLGTNIDNGTEVRYFKIDRVLPGQIDVATSTFVLDIKYDDNTTDTVSLTRFDVTEEDVILRWTITSSMAEDHEGNLTVQLRGSNLAGNTWSSAPATFYIVDVVNNPSTATASTTLSELQQLETEIEANETLRAGAETSRATAETGRVNAESGRVLAESGRVSAEAQRVANFPAMTLQSEGWAVGKQGGVDVVPGSPYYHNNSKYWSDQAASVGGAVSYTNVQELTDEQKSRARTNIGAYAKPSGGITENDLSSSVNASLDKADSALQTHQDISGKENKGYITIGGTTYQIELTNVDPGQAVSGKFIFVYE